MTMAMAMPRPNFPLRRTTSRPTLRRMPSSAQSAYSKCAKSSPLTRAVSPVQFDDDSASDLPSEPELESESSSSSKPDSASTLEHVDDYEGATPSALTFGHPLQRMRAVSLPDSPFPSPASSVTSLVSEYDFDGLVEELLSTHPEEDIIQQDFIIVEPSTPISHDSFIIKPVRLNSPELHILLSLNSPELRADPWNPAPRILQTIAHGQNLYLCMERLFAWDHPPLRAVAQYVDFIRQTLDGLAFFHENHIAQLSYASPASQMVALGTLHADTFDRARYPVRYYHVDFSRAIELGPWAGAESMRADVVECGTMVEGLLYAIDLPKIGGKFKPLVQAMKSGTFSAEDARKLFEALCKTLEAPMFDMPVTVLR